MKCSEIGSGSIPPEKFERLSSFSITFRFIIVTRERERERSCADRLKHMIDEIERYRYDDIFFYTGINY